MVREMKLPVPLRRQDHQEADDLTDPGVERA
jgi:hypothetical protein